VSKKRRARTRRQSQIRRQEQIRRESAGRRAETRHSELRADDRRAQREAELAPLAARYRLLSWLLALSAICLAYGIGLWFVQILARDTLTREYPGLWSWLVIGLAAAVGLCWIPGLFVTYRDRAWFWVFLIVVPFTTMPALLYFCFTRRQMLRRQMRGQPQGGGRGRRPPRPPGGRPPRGPKRPGGGRPSSTDSVKLLGDR
jgi:hypothetical protein